MNTMDQYGWRPATPVEIDRLAKKMDLVSVFHSVADCSLWYRREEAENCKSYMDCTSYARRWELADEPKPCEINQKNVDAWEAR